MIGTTESKNRVLIRLTEKRWFHIVENHDDLGGMAYEVLDVINSPDMVIEGIKDELLAVRKYGEKYLVVVYREVTEKDGFIITAFFTTKIDKIMKRRKIKWKGV